MYLTKILLSFFLLCFLTPFVIGQENPCKDILIDGLRDIVEIDYNKSLSYNIKKWLSSKRFEEFINQKDSNFKLEIPIFDKLLSFGSKRKQESFQELNEAINSGKLEILTEDQSVHIATQLVNESIVQAWKDCMIEWIRHQPKGPFKCTSKEIGNHIVFEIDYDPPALTDPPPIIANFVLVGATPVEEYKDAFKMGQRIKSSQIFVCRRYGLDEVIFVLETNRGIANEFLKRKKSPKEIEWEKELERRKEAWEEYDRNEEEYQRKLNRWYEYKKYCEKENERIRQTRKITAAGGEGGIPFESTILPPGSHITEVFGRGRTGKYIDNLGFRYIDANGIERSTGYFGKGMGGLPFSFTIPSGDKLIGIIVRTGRVVDSIQFMTKTMYSTKFGGDGSPYNRTEMYIDGYEVVGFHGGHGRVIDKFGIILRPENNGLLNLGEQPKRWFKKPDFQRSQ